MPIQDSSVQDVAGAPIVAAAKKRRPRGEGGYRFDAKRKLHIFTVPRPSRPGSPATFYGKTQQEAMDKRNEYLNDLRSGRIDESGRLNTTEDLPRLPTVGEWLDYWVENEIKPRYIEKDGE